MISAFQKLYSDLDADNRGVFLDLAQARYEETVPRGTDVPDEEWVSDLLSEYDPVTMYVYANEVSRKRGYAVESVIATGGDKDAYRRSLNYWTRFTQQYADTVWYRATLKAYKDAGVKKVKWVTEKDDYVCEFCKSRNGVVYELSKVPRKPHRMCRCIVVPADD